MDCLKDIELLDHIRGDNRLAFAEIVNRYSATLFRFVNKRISNPEDTQDILQEIFASLWKRRAEIHIEDSFYPYLFKAARYEVIDWMVKKQKNIERASTLNEMSDMLFITRSSEEDLIAKELSQLIDKEVDRMPKTMRNVFTMSRNQAMSIKNIALELSLSEQTVKNNISIALSKLKSKFR